MPPPDPGAVRVKICGLTDEAAIEAAASAGADWIGFNFFPRSPRFVSPDRAEILQRRVPRSIGSVALLVRPEDDEITRVLDTLTVCALQLYDTAARCAAIQDRFGVPVWQAIGVSDASELPLESVFEALVIESKPPAGADRPGGNAQGFDWRITSRWQAPAPWLLAGGLRPDTVGQAVATSGARAVDVSSGVETTPGRKDPALIHAFVAAARAGGEPQLTSS